MSDRTKQLFKQASELYAICNRHETAIDITIGNSDWAMRYTLEVSPTYSDGEETVIYEDTDL